MKMLETKQLLHTKYIKVYEHDYEGGRVFYNATRREKEKQKYKDRIEFYLFVIKYFKIKIISKNKH